VANICPLFVPLKENRFFALSTLKDFCAGQLDPLLDMKSPSTFILDFSQVLVWDIAALLWLSIALQYYRQHDLVFSLRLPDERYGRNIEEKERLQKSADFLRRWRFDRALSHIGDPRSVLLPEQAEYFDQGPQNHYMESPSVINPDGVLDSLISNRLVAIRDMTVLNTRTGQREVSDEMIQKCIYDFQDARLGNILYNNCSIKKEDADCFADHLVTESLLNAKQHPNATTAMLSVAVMGKSRELILTVADNGDSIPSTILSVFNKKNGTKYDISTLSQQALKIRESITHFATQPYITSKPLSLETNEAIGLGLTYIKQGATGRFQGKLRIICESVQLIYEANNPSTPHSKDWHHSWPGNLLRISIPLKPNRD
jgi:hypothetical protein